MKRIILILISIISMVSNMYASGFETINGLRYLINTDAKTATLVADTVKYFGDIVVPEKVTLDNIDYPVVAFANDVFENCSELTSISIPSTINSLGESCFSGCSSLTKIELPASVTNIERYCFSGCRSLTSITIPSSVTSLGESCFSGCNSLTSITIPSSVTSLGESCFLGCSSLTSIVIPSSVKTLGDKCFSDCSSLASITIPLSVSSLGSNCFSHCSSLASITIPSSVTWLGEDCFYDCKSLTSMIIPSSVTMIGGGCFSNCTSLASITIPSSVSFLGGGCFWGCSSLESITIPSSVLRVGTFCFDNCEKLSAVYCYAITPPSINPNFAGDMTLIESTNSILYVPASSVDKYKQASGWKDFIAILPIPGTETDMKGKCEKPCITFDNGKLHFESSTIGAEYHYTITSNDMKADAYSEDGDVTLAAAYNITTYSTADDYSPSDKATATLYWVDGRIDDPTGISIVTTAKRGIVVSSQGGNMTLSGLDDGERVSFYSVNGSNLGTVKANHGTATGFFPQGQVIIVKVGKNSLKVAL